MLLSYAFLADGGDRSQSGIVPWIFPDAASDTLSDRVSTLEIHSTKSNVKTQQRQVWPWTES